MFDSIVKDYESLLYYIDKILTLTKTFFVNFIVSEKVKPPHIGRQNYASGYFIVPPMDLGHGRHTKFKIEYHFFWIAKYRYHVLQEGCSPAGQRVCSLNLVKV